MEGNNRLQKQISGLLEEINNLKTTMNEHEGKQEASFAETLKSLEHRMYLYTTNHQTQKQGKFFDCCVSSHQISHTSSSWKSLSYTQGEIEQKLRSDIKAALSKNNVELTQQFASEDAVHIEIDSLKAKIKQQAIQSQVG